MLIFFTSLKLSISGLVEAALVAGYIEQVIPGDAETKVLSPVHVVPNLGFLKIVSMIGSDDISRPMPLLWEGGVNQVIGDHFSFCHGIVGN